MSDKIVETVIEYITMSGVKLHITPLNIAVTKAINQKAIALFPYPDPEPYMHELPPPDAPGALSDPMEDDEYKALKQETDAQRNTWVNHAVLDYAVSYPDFASRQELMDALAPQREKLRKIADLPKDDWEATRDYLILSGNEIRPRLHPDGIARQTNVSSDFASVINMAQQSVELTGGEIADGLRIFRPAVSRLST